MADPKPLYSVVQAQMQAMDSMLLDAYGTVYKLAGKLLLQDKIDHTWSVTEELLLARTLVNNLWSLLDYCCVLLFCWHYGREPTAQEARERSIKFPCDFTQLSKLKRDPVQWEKKRVSLVLLPRYGDIDDATYQQVRGIFHTFQYKGSDSMSKEVRDLYLLHHLKEQLTHSSLHIISRARSKAPDLLRSIKVPLSTAVTVTVPFNPCSEDSSYDDVPLVDALFSCCQAVEQVRDSMFHRLFGERKFDSYFRFELTPQTLKVQIQGGESSKGGEEGRSVELPLQLLHLECYGLQAELRQ